MNSVLAFAKTRPLVFSIGFTSFKTGLADFVTQTQIEKRETLDVKRNATFWLFGAWFLGGVQYGVYVKLFSRLFPRAEAFALLPLREKLRDTAGQATVVKQVGRVSSRRCAHHVASRRSSDRDIDHRNHLRAASDDRMQQISCRRRDPFRSSPMPSSI